MAFTNAVVALTYKCNSRCKMCGIWKTKKNAELPASEFAELPRSLREINISGGEPFLRKDLVEVIENIQKACPKAKLVFSTNGLLSKKIVSDMKQILRIFPTARAMVSIDGIGKTHDKIRGVKGAFKKALATIKGLKRLGVKSIGLAFTAQERNLGEIFRVFSLAEKNGLDYSFVLAQSSGFYFRKKNPRIKNIPLLEEQLRKVIERQLRSASPRQLFRAWYENACIDFARSGERRIKCRAAEKSFFVAPDGSIFACNVLEEKIGKLGGKIDAKKAQKIARNCEKCFMLCSTMPIAKKHYPEIALWIIENKLQLLPKKQETQHQ